MCPQLPSHFTPAGEGRWILDGYVVLWRPDHPLANARGTVLEHRMVLYDEGIDPAGWHVHHRNHDRSDNTVANLELREPSEHSRMHIRQRWDAVARSGNAATTGNTDGHLTTEGLGE